jgi:FtsP/CotA-like multicopper oxidase with cupredoxin domain
MRAATIEKGSTMLRNAKRKPGAGIVVALSLVTAGFTAMPSVPAGAAFPYHSTGVICTESPTATFTLNTRSGYISLPDGNSAYLWGYSAGSDGFQHPGPVLCVQEGQTVTVHLHNTLSERVSIIFPGQVDVKANGVPTQPEFSGTGKLTSLTRSAAAGGGNVTYSFVANKPGTFLYESGTNPQKQVRMGLFGALIVRPTMGDNFAYNDPDSEFNPQTEFLALLSEIDPILNSRVEQGKSFNMNNYRPRYWMINGRGFPDTIADNNASWLPTQPYGALAEIEPQSAANPLPALDRYLSVGTEDFPFHPHGNNGTVIGRDGNPLVGPSGQDLSFEKFSVPVGPGQTWDVLFSWKDDNNYSPDNVVPTTVPNLQNQEIGTFYGGTPYLGVQGTLPPGFSSMNECGEFYIISHNHALYQITSWGGIVMTGQITYTRVDPPAPNDC